MIISMLLPPLAFALLAVVPSSTAAPDAPAPAAPPGAPAAAGDVDQPAPATATAATEHLVRLRLAFDKPDCDAVLDDARYVEDHRAATLAERLEAMFMRAYCHVILGNTASANAVFTAIVREDIEAQPPFDVEPRIRVMLDAARAQERQRAADARAAARRAIVEKLALAVRAPAMLSLDGGSRAVFYVDLTDPDGVVRSMRIDFRKQGEPDFYALPVTRQADGGWRGEIPGTYTRSVDGLVIEWFISATDAKGERLVSEGARDDPRRLTIGPGSAIALDLPANERTPQPTRLAAAAVVAPILSWSGVALGAVATIIIDQAFGLIPGTDDGFLRRAVVLYTGSLLPPFTGGVGAWLVSSTLLDGSDVWIPVVVVGACGAVAAGALLIDGVTHDGRLGYGPEGADEQSTAAGVALLAAFAGGALGGAVTTALVALDPPTE